MCNLILNHLWPHQHLAHQGVSLVVCALGIHALRESVALSSARGTRQSPIYTRQRLCPVLHSAKNTRQITRRQRRLCRVPTLGKVETEKNPKKWEFLPKKMEFFFIDGGPHRPAPTLLRHFSREFHGYTADAIRTRDLPLCTYLLYHYTTLSLVSGFRFSSQYIILNRV